METGFSICVTAPAYNEEAIIEQFALKVSEVLEKITPNWEILVVDNGSQDKTLEILKELNRKNSQIKYLKLSRNFGHQGGLLAGIHNASGDLVVTMDADLQHPPEVIPEMIKKWREGYNIIEMVKTESNVGIIRRVFNHFFYKIIDRLAGMKLGRGDFRMMEREVVETLKALPETTKYLRGLVPWVGFQAAAIPYAVQPRAAGRSKFRVRHLFDFAFSGITSFSIQPLRIATHLGLILLIPSAFLVLKFLYTGLVHVFWNNRTQLPPGWATIAIITSFFGAVQLLSLGILGEYVGRIYLEVKKRPGFVIDEESKE